MSFKIIHTKLSNKRHTKEVLSKISTSLSNSSRTIAFKENPPTPKLTLTARQLSSEAIVWFPPTLKLTLTLTQAPTITGGGGFSSGVIVRIPCQTNTNIKNVIKKTIHCLLINYRSLQLVIGWIL